MDKKTPNNSLFGNKGSKIGRLKSFKGQRDLTLGASAASTSGSKPPLGGSGPPNAAASAKKFVPNLNVQRIKKEEVKTAPTNSNKNKFNKKDGGFKGGKSGNQKGRPELIQTMQSVFADGLNMEGIRKRSSGGPSYSSKSDLDGGNFGGGSGGKGFMSKHNTQISKEEEEKRIKALLRDDFIDDNGPEGLFVPVQLPMIKSGDVFKQENKGCDVKDEEETVKSSELMLKKKKQRTILDSDDDEDKVDDKLVDRDSVPKVVEKEMEFSDLVRGQKGDLLFIQFPDHLPGAKAINKEGAIEIKKEPGVVANESQQPNTNKAFNNQFCTLQDLPEGYLGKIQIRKSGKTKLQIGNEYFDIDIGTQVGFLQDLVSIQVNKDSPREVGDMTVLGHVKNRVVFNPDFESLFQNDDLSDDLFSSSTDCVIKEEQL